MLKLFRYIKPLAPYLFIIWILVILVFSSLPKLPEAKIITDNFEFKVDFVFHFIEYTALSFLALLTFQKSATSLGSRKVLYILFGLFLFGILDESHQLLIPGRSFNITDIISNCAGILAGIQLSLWLNRIESWQSKISLPTHIIML